MRLFGRHAAAVLAGLLLVVLGTGCEDEPEPNIPSPSPTPTETESSSSTSPTPEPESAEAFIERWNMTSTEMQNTGETAAFEAMNTQGCSPCANLIDTVTTYYAAGGYVQATPWDIESLAERPGSTANEAVFDVSFSASPTKFKPSATAPVESTTGGDNVLAMTLQRDGASWLVANYLVAAQ